MSLPPPSMSAERAGRGGFLQMELPLPRLVPTRAVRVVRRPDGVTELRPGKIVTRAGVGAAAEAMGVSRDTVVRMIEDGTLRGRKMRPDRANSKYLVEMETVWAWLEGRGG